MKRRNRIVVGILGCALFTTNITSIAIATEKKPDVFYDVTMDMTSADYWIHKVKNTDNRLMDLNQITFF